MTALQLKPAVNIFKFTSKLNMQISYNLQKTMGNVVSSQKSLAVVTQMLNKYMLQLQSRTPDGTSVK